MTDSPQPAGDRRWILPALLAGAVCLLYADTLLFSFVYDDNFQIVDNTWLTSAHFIPRYFTQHVWAFAGISGVYWRPLFLLWLFLVRSLFGLAPAAWHATTILLHAAATLLVFALARRLTADRATAAIAALIFGVHPALLESVAWISGVSDPLLALLLIPAFLFYLDWHETRVARALWFSLAFYLLALMAKEPGVMLLPIVFCHAWIYGDSVAPSLSRPGLARQGGGFSNRVRTAISAILPYLPLTLAYLIFHAVLFGRATYATSPATTTNNLLTIPSLLVFYLKLLVWPAPISPEYPLRLVTAFSVTQVLVPTIVLIAVAALLWFWARVLDHRHDGGGRLVCFACAWLVLPILPVLYLKPIDAFDFAHARYLYLPCIGFALLLAAAVRTIPADERTFAALPSRQFGAALLVILALAIANFVQQVYWASNIVLFARGVSVAPRNPTALTNLGIELGKRGRYSDAIALMQRAMAENPLDWHVNFSLGYTYFLMGQNAQAVPLMETSVRLRHGDAEADQYAYLGMTALRLGDFAKAEAAVRNALRRRPDSARYHLALALILEQQKRPAEAAAEFRATLQYDPQNAEARSRLTQLDKTSGGPP